MLFSQTSPSLPPHTQTQSLNQITGIIIIPTHIRLWEKWNELILISAESSIWHVANTEQMSIIMFTIGFLSKIVSLGQICLNDYLGHLAGQWGDVWEHAVHLGDWINTSVRLILYLRLISVTSKWSTTRQKAFNWEWRPFNRAIPGLPQLQGLLFLSQQENVCIISISVNRYLLIPIMCHALSRI